MLLKATGLQGVSKLVQICREARTLANDGILRVLCLHDHGLLPGKEDVQIRIAQLFGFTAVIGHATDRAHEGGSMVMLSGREIRMKQTLKECGIARVSPAWSGEVGNTTLHLYMHGMTAPRDLTFSVT